MFVAALLHTGDSLAQQRIKGSGETFSLKKFQAKYGYNSQQMKQRFGAVGRISCPFSTATAFLIAQPDIFITSDHVFLSPEKKAKERGRVDRCFVEFFYSKGKHKIKTGSLVHGMRTSKSAYNFQWNDWVIGRLERKVPGVSPFKMAEGGISHNSPIMMVSQGINDFRPRVCVGKVSSSLGNTSVNQFTTTCDTGPGASGGPIIAGDPNKSTEKELTVVGLTWGYEDPYWQQIGTAHLAIPLTDRGIQEALDKVMIVSSAPKDDDIVTCTYSNGSKIATMRALCRQELGRQIIDCSLPSGSILVTAGEACLKAGGKIQP
jgi:hypothetical protein